MLTFKWFLSEASLSAPNLFANVNRIDTMEAKMRSGDPFVMVDKSSVVFPASPENIGSLNTLRTHKNGNRYTFKSADGKDYPLSSFEKTREFGSSGGGGSLNSMGKELADAGERATIRSFYKDLVEPEDTEEQLFIDNPDAFDRWSTSFVQTKLALDKVLGRGFQNKFEVIHDSTDGGIFTNAINAFCRKIGMNKDSWNPADIWLISKSDRTRVEQTLMNIVTENDGDILIGTFNYAVYKFFLDKMLVPVSLKQITSKTYKLEYTNVPGEEIPSFNVSIKNFVCNMKLDSKEIGAFTFTNKETGGTINMQTKGYPYSSMSTQTEITSDGSKSGGRVGKVPAAIVDKVYKDNGFFKIDPRSYFENKLEDTKQAQINEWVNWYAVVSKDNSVTASIPSNKIEEFIKTTLLEFGNPVNAGNINAFKHKIQGLAMQYFFVKNKKNLSNIITQYILGGKKINTKAGFFIKVY